MLITANISNHEYSFSLTRLRERAGSKTANLPKRHAKFEKTVEGETETAQIEGSSNSITRSDSAIVK
jgi:hypothetical protein